MVIKRLLNAGLHRCKMVHEFQHEQTITWDFHKSTRLEELRRGNELNQHQMAGDKKTTESSVHKWTRRQLKAYKSPDPLRRRELKHTINTQFLHYLHLLSNFKKSQISTQSNFHNAIQINHPC